MTVRRQFLDHLEQHCDRVGFDAPHDLIFYLADLMSERLERTELIPQPSFAERYLQLYSEHRLTEFKDYADSALFFVSLLPEYGHRRGLNMDYYATLGISVYYSLGDLAKDPRFTQLGNWFYYLQRFLNSALKSDRSLDLWRDLELR